MSVPIVVDEWLFEDLSGNNGYDQQQNTLSFLNKLLQICDKIVILQESPFNKKINKFIKESNSTAHLRAISQFFNSGIILNSDKTEIIESQDVKPLTPRLQKIVPKDDQYLFQAYFKLQSKGSFILTSDGRLYQKVRKEKTIRIYMKDEYIKEYLKRLV